MRPIKILITAGPTIEPIDPVRFISNRSTGVMGYKIAEEASRRRHVVTLISGPIRFTHPRVKKFINIETARDLLNTLKKEIKLHDCLIMCAAVGDFRPCRVFKKKIKRSQRVILELIPNKDILKELAKFKKGKLFIGFSLETENHVENSIKKLKEKNLDLIVANKLTDNHNPFGTNKLGVLIIDKSGQRTTLANKSKSYISYVLLDKIEELWYLKRKGKI